MHRIEMINVNIKKKKILLFVGVQKCAGVESLWVESGCSCRLPPNEPHGEAPLMKMGV